MKYAIPAMACLVLMAAWRYTGATDKPQSKSTDSMFEIAINKSKEGQHQEFLESRKRFVDILGQEPATLNEGKWVPFYTVDPDMDLSRILIGMTHWNSMEGFGEAASRLMPQEAAKAYFASFDPLAYAILEPLDGRAFDLNSIKKEGQVVEFAIRKGKTKDAFGATRDAFFESLQQYDGFQFAREFKVHKLDQAGMPNLAENTQAVIIVWENSEAFQAAAQPVFASSKYQQFAKNLDVETYFASVPAE